MDAPKRFPQSRKVNLCNNNNGMALIAFIELMDMPEELVFFVLKSLYKQIFTGNTHAIIGKTHFRIEILTSDIRC